MSFIKDFVDKLLDKDRMHEWSLGANEDGEPVLRLVIYIEPKDVQMLHVIDERKSDPVDPGLDVSGLFEERP